MTNTDKLLADLRAWIAAKTAEVNPLLKMNQLTDTDILELLDRKTSNPKNDIELRLRENFEFLKARYDKVLAHYSPSQKNIEKQLEEDPEDRREDMFLGMVTWLRSEIKRHYGSKAAPLSTWKLAKARHELYPEKKGSGTHLSRIGSWHFYLERARESLEALQVLQEYYGDWETNLPENLRESPTAEKLQAIADLDFQSALDVLDEAEQADVPMGFGRD
jgi:hypothetical protein